MSKINSGLARAAYGGIAVLVLGAALRGTSGVAGAIWDRVESTPALTITLLRVALAIPFLLLIAGRTPRGSRTDLARAWKLIVGLGASFAAAQSMFFEAIPLAGVTMVVIISLCSAVLFVTLLSIPLFGEQLNRRIMLAVTMALAGTVMLAQAGGTGEEAQSLVDTPNYLWGLAAALGSGVAFAAYILLAKVATQRSDMPQSRLLAWTLIVALVLLIPLAVISGGIQLDLAPEAWGLALWVGVVATGLGYWLLQVGLQSSSTTVAAVITLLEPTVAALLAWLLLGENLTALQLGGAALMLGSVLLLTLPAADLPQARVEGAGGC
jgi:drug/metabolite transporter, DME family